VFLYAFDPDRVERQRRTVKVCRKQMGSTNGSRARRRLLGKITVQDIEKGYWLLLTLCGPF
jgi:hypothetical protein